MDRMRIRICGDGEDISDTVRSACATLPGGVYTVTVEKAASKRSGDQNAYLWGCVYPMLLDGLTDAGWELTGLEQVHEYMKSVMAGESVVNRTTGEIVTLPSATSRMSKAEFSAYCDRLRDYAREFLGVEIPDPDRFWRRGRKET